MSKEHEGLEVEDTDDAWLVDAYEEEIVAEFDEHGIVMESVSEVENMLSKLCASARTALGRETLWDEVTQVAPAQQATAALTMIGDSRSPA